MMATGIRFANTCNMEKDRESLSRLPLSEFKLATNKTLEYDMPQVSLKMICTARFGLIPVGRIARE